MKILLSVGCITCSSNTETEELNGSVNEFSDILLSVGRGRLNFRKRVLRFKRILLITSERIARWQHHCIIGPFQMSNL